MCGRYRLTAKERYLLDHFELDEDPSWTPRWNIAPTQLIPIVRQHGTAAKRSFDLGPVGSNSILGQGSIHRDKNHQCHVGDRSGQASLPRSAASATPVSF